MSFRSSSCRSVMRCHPSYRRPPCHREGNYPRGEQEMRDPQSAITNIDAHCRVKTFKCAMGIYIVDCRLGISYFLSLSKDIEYLLWELFVRLIPTRLEILLPVFGPGTSVVIDKTRVGIRQLCRPAVGVLDIAQTLDVGV